MTVGALAAARRRAESLMADSVTVTRTTGSGVDPDTGRPTGTTTTIYSGACRIRLRRISNAGPSHVGGDALVVQEMQVWFPSDAPAVHVGDVVVLNAAPLHIRDVGARFRVAGVEFGTQTSAQRCQVEVVSG